MPLLREAVSRMKRRVSVGPQFRMRRADDSRKTTARNLTRSTTSTSIIARLGQLIIYEGGLEIFGYPSAILITEVVGISIGLSYCVVESRRFVS